jgi:hypothetical protein
MSNISYAAQPQWRSMATIEVDPSCADLSTRLAGLKLDFRLEAAPAAPQGHVWFDILLDASKGERRCARAAHVLLSTLQHAADAGDLVGFHIVAGAQWLEIDMSQREHPRDYIPNVA